MLDLNPQPVDRRSNTLPAAPLWHLIVSYIAQNVIRWLENTLYLLETLLQKTSMHERGVNSRADAASMESSG